ncbi:hypothetical protein [Enorma massiliensis]|uniref:hypothetical protein n=1 Tax=Enorma massiliensis TaxID=1472761 RepID=UPI003AF0EE6D
MAQPDWLDDKQNITVGERGVRSGRRHELSLTVRFDDARGGSYQLPAFGGCGGRDFDLCMYFDFDWHVDWGDGAGGHVKGRSSSFGGEVEQGSLVHTYESGGTYRIVIRPTNKPSKTEGAAPGWLQAFGYTDRLLYDGTTGERIFLKGVDNLIEVDGVLDDYAINIELIGACENMFALCKNITMGPSFTFESDKTQAGHDFCKGMFFGHGPAFTMNSQFNLPQDIVAVGNSFCEGMFNATFGGYATKSAFEMNEQFNLPQKISGYVGPGFCSFMFCQNESDTFTMNDVFNLPQGISSAGHAFCSRMFSSCRGEAFSMNRVFNIPPVLGQVGDEGFADMFSGCNGRSFQVNESFVLPNMTGGRHLAWCMFYGCRSEALNQKMKGLIADNPFLCIWVPPD